MNVNNCIDNYNEKTIKLLNNLDFNDDSSYKNPQDTSLGDINGNGTVEPIKTEVTTGVGFTPIGMETYVDEVSGLSLNPYFGGTFNGNDKEINNLYINIEKIDTSRHMYIGLFGYANGITMGNLTLEGNINVMNSEYTTRNVNIGGFIGYTTSSTIESCENKVSINVSSNFDDEANNWCSVGGIVGSSDYSNDVVNCVNNGNLSIEKKVSGYIGGIIGSNSNMANNISNCINNADIIGEELGGEATWQYWWPIEVGGIVGENFYECSVTNCINNGLINVEHKLIYNTFVGGIIGDNQGDSIGPAVVSQCINYGEITLENVGTDTMSGRPYIGGISGHNLSIIEKCGNEARIENSGKGNYVYAAGIAGMSEEGGTVSQCYNSGDIYTTGEPYPTDASTSCQAAGIVCSNTGSNSEVTIENCYNIGTITNNGAKYESTSLNLGGICGHNSLMSRIRNCYNVGNLVSDKDEIRAGGIAGAGATTSVIEDCYYLEGICDVGAYSVPTATESRTEEQMKTQEFVEELQGTQTETIWKIVEGRNNGYPILSWQE